MNVGVLGMGIFSDSKKLFTPVTRLFNMSIGSSSGTGFFFFLVLLTLNGSFFKISSISLKSSSNDVGSTNCTSATICFPFLLPVTTGNTL